MLSWWRIKRFFVGLFPGNRISVFEAQELGIEHQYHVVSKLKEEYKVLSLIYLPFNPWYISDFKAGLEGINKRKWTVGWRDGQRLRLSNQQASEAVANS